MDQFFLFYPFTMNILEKVKQVLSININWKGKIQGSSRIMVGDVLGQEQRNMSGLLKQGIF